MQYSPVPVPNDRVYGGSVKIQIKLKPQFKPTYGFDISLPIPAMEKYIAETEAQLRQEFGSIQCWVYGHVGDGNLHLGVWGESIQENCKQQIESIIYEPLMALGGSISAEHGIGLEKKDYLRLKSHAARN